MAAQAYRQRQQFEFHDTPEDHGHLFSRIAVGLLPARDWEERAVTVVPSEALNLLQQLSLDSPKSGDAVKVLRQLHVKGFRLAVDRHPNGEVTLDEAGLLRLVTAIIRELRSSKEDGAAPDAHLSSTETSSLSPIPSIPGYNPTRSLDWYHEMQDAMHAMLAEVDKVRSNKTLAPQARFNAENALWAEFQTKYPSELKCGVDIFSDKFATR